MKEKRSKKQVSHPDYSEEMALFMRQVYVSYDKKKIVLHNISLDANKGEILGLIGGSGSGKSTILRCLTGQVKPYRGFVRTANCDVVKEKDKLINRIGYVPDSGFPS